MYLQVQASHACKHCELHVTIEATGVGASHTRPCAWVRLDVCLPSCSVAEDIKAAVTKYCLEHSLDFNGKVSEAGTE